MGTCSRNGGSARALTAVFECCQEIWLLVNAVWKPGAPRGAERLRRRGLRPHGSQEAVIPDAESHTANSFRSVWHRLEDSGWENTRILSLPNPAAWVFVCQRGGVISRGASDYPLWGCVYVWEGGERVRHCVCSASVSSGIDKLFSWVAFFFPLWVPHGWGSAGHTGEYKVHLLEYCACVQYRSTRTQPYIIRLTIKMHS